MKDSHVFIDTNILVYAHDSSAGFRHDRAASVVKEAWQFSYPPAISIQVLQEFYVNILKKKDDRARAQKIISNYFTWEVINNDMQLMQQAFEAQIRWKLSFWDSVIVVAALKAKAKLLWSEDFNSGQRFDSLQVVNPLL